MLNAFNPDVIYHVYSLNHPTVFILETFLGFVEQ